MQSEVVRLIKQVEQLERMHRAGVTFLPAVDELFAIGRECRATLDAQQTRPQQVVPVFKSRPDAATIAAEAGAAVEQVLAQVLTRVLAEIAA